MSCARKLRITGTVQGVGFRWTAKRIADAMGMAGWVRNNPDGSVSLVLAGENGDMDEFMKRLDDAMGGYVAAVESGPTIPPPLQGFTIER